MATVHELLQAAAPSRVRLARCESVEQVLRELAAEARLPDPGRVIACLWDQLPVIPELIDQTLNRLAETALSLWPAWYGPPPFAEHMGEPALANVLAAVCRPTSRPWI